MREPILVVNAGSSSIKFSVFETMADRSLSAGAHGQVEGIGTSPHLEITDPHGKKLADGRVAGDGYAGAIAAIHDWFAAHVGSEAGFDGAGHRVVHGGSAYSEPVLIDSQVMAVLESLIPLAPLHQPHHISAIRAISAIAPKMPQVACFDTAFHRSQPALAQEFALPRELAEKGVRRYGFHGLSYEYIVSALPEFMPDCARKKLVVAHLGNGASMCAIDCGRSVAVTMGFTAVDGLPMGTRTGALDPGVILYLLQHEGMDAAAIEDLIYQRSGLLGVSGVSSDMRTLLASDAPSAKEAVDLFVYRIGRELGSLAAALGGLDAFVFTAGIGEHAPEIRARACREAHWLGITLDERANTKGGPRISTSGSTVSAWVIPTDENLMIARHTRRLLDLEGPRCARGQSRARYRHRQRSVDRRRLRPCFARCRREPCDNLPQREGETLCRAARRRARRRVVPAAGGARGAADDGRLRGNPREMGASRFPGSLARLRPQGGFARAPGRQLGRGLPDRDGHLLPLLCAHGKAGGAADDRWRRARHDELLRRGQGHCELQPDGTGQGSPRGRRPLPGLRLGPKGIRVHAVSPGPLKTWAASGVAHFDELLAEVELRAPERDLVDILDIGAATAFLYSPFAKLITGGTIYVDGGYNIRG